MITSAGPWRFLTIDQDGRLKDMVLDRYPDSKVIRAASFMAGIDALSRDPVDAVIAFVEPSQSNSKQAVEGLREAVGPNTRVVLCCEPSAEPFARKVLAAGADDYVIYPPTDEDLDGAFGIAAHSEEAEESDAGLESDDRSDASRIIVEPTFAELLAMEQLLMGLDASLPQLTRTMAELVKTGLETSTAKVELDGVDGTVGPDVFEYVLTQEIFDGSECVGFVAVGPGQQGDYTPADRDKLAHYGRLLGHVRRAAAGHRRWRNLALTDDVTGLPNRRYLLDFLEKMLKRASRERFLVTLLLFDIDDFKQYNDEYGHDVGDEILREAGHLFRKTSRSDDVVARYGGDEFAVVFWDSEAPRVIGSKHPTETLQVLQRCRQALRECEFACLGPQGKGRLTVSGGLAGFPWDATDPVDLICRADEALLRAKRHGKGRVYLVGEGEEALLDAADGCGIICPEE